jgi:hypothetical protein
MIQRIQSLYLLLTTVVSFLFLKGGILNFSDLSGNTMHLTFSGLNRAAGLLEKNWPVTIIILMIPVLSIIILVLFRKRDLQLMLSKVLIALILGFIVVLAYYGYALTTKYEAKLIPGLMMAVPLLQLIFSFLAYRGIKKDDNLVKSYDRLR